MVLTKAERVAQKAHDLTQRAERSSTEAVEIAIDMERVAAIPKPKGRVDREGLAKLLAEVDAFPVVDPRSPDEMIDYDEIGIPR